MKNLIQDFKNFYLFQSVKPVTLIVQYFFKQKTAFTAAQRNLLA
jgi:hypothetical protein